MDHGKLIVQEGSVVSTGPGIRIRYGHPVGATPQEKREDTP
jgi:hypothetical protein